MKKILLTTVILIISMCKGLYAQTNEWIDISTTSMDGYNITELYFVPGPASGVYPGTSASGFFYGQNVPENKGILGYTSDAGTTWTTMVANGNLNSYGITKANYYPVYTVYGNKGTVLYSYNSYGDAPNNFLAADIPAEYQDVDFVTGGLSVDIYRNKPFGALSDGTNLYYLGFEQQGPPSNIVTIFKEVTVDTPIEEITEIVYAGSNTLYALGKGGQFFQSVDFGESWEFVAAHGVDFTSGTFLNNSDYTTMTLIAAGSGNTVLYTTEDGGETINPLLTINNYGTFKEFNYLERENAYYSLSDEGVLIKIAEDFSSYERVEDLLPETDVKINSFFITHRLLKYVTGDNGLFQVYVPETKVVIEVIKSEDYDYIFSFRDLSEGYIVDNGWNFEGAEANNISNRLEVNGVSYVNSATYKVTLTLNHIYTSYEGPAGNVVTVSDFVEVNPSMDFTWEIVNYTPYSDYKVKNVVFPEQQNMTGYASIDETTFSGIVLKTVDAGTNWEQVLSFSLIGEEVRGIRASSFPSLEVGYAGTYGHYNYISYTPPVLWKTANGGETWKTLDLSQFNKYFVDRREVYNTQDMYFWTEDEGVIAFSDVVIYTADGGETWEESAFDSSNGGDFNITKLSFVDENNIYGIGSEQQIFKSEDGGQNWRLISTLANETSSELNAVDFRDANYGIVVANTAQDGLFITEDGGQNWTAYNTGSSYIMNAVHFTNDTLVYVAGAGEIILKSEDAGQNWEPEEHYPIGATFESLSSTATGVTYVGGNMNSIKRYVPELNVEFEMSVDADSTYVEFINRSVGLITEFEWEVDGQVLSTEFDFGGFTLERPNHYFITLTGKTPDGESDSHTDDINMPIDEKFVPEASINPTPANGEQLVNFEDVALAWENNSGTEYGELTFNVYMGESEDAMTRIAEEITAMAYTVSVSNLEEKTTYYWRVDTRNDYATQRGDVWSFTTGEDGGSVNLNDAGNGFSLYPNPFADSFVIRLGNLEAAAVEVSLKDLQGRTVYSSTFDATGDVTVGGLTELASGVYVCTIKVNGITSVQKIVKQ